MLEEILQVLSISPQIDKIIIVTKDKKALDISEKFDTLSIIDDKESGVNNAVALADKYLLKNEFETSIVVPQDIPYIKTQDIDFMLKFKTNSDQKPHYSFIFCVHYSSAIHQYSRSKI